MSFDEMSTYRYNMHMMFNDIVQIHSDEYVKWASKYADAMKMPVDHDDQGSPIPPIEWERYYEARERSAVIVITFAAMAVEALLYDYAAGQLTDQFVKNNLDKLTADQKFLIYPLLICQKQPDKGGQAYSSLKKLMKLRNKLVHFKSIPFKIEELSPKATDFHEDWNIELKEGVQNARECLNLVVSEIAGLHDGPVPFCLQRLLNSPQV